MGRKNARKIVIASSFGLVAASLFGYAAFNKQQPELQLLGAGTSLLAHLFRVVGDATPQRSQHPALPLPDLAYRQKIDRLSFGMIALQPFVKLVDYGLSHPIAASARVQEPTRPLVITAGIINNQPVLAVGFAIAWGCDRLLIAYGRKER